MPTPDEQLSILKSRVRSLERSLTEAEALSLEQIECTHRLETQLFELRTRLEERTHELSLCRQEQAVLVQGPRQEDYQQQARHIEDLQKQVWELERRPTLDHFQILKQQLATHQTEIETLKAELSRRIAPSHYQQLQQQLKVLKEQAHQLASYATQLPQVQQEAAAAQAQIKSLGSQLAATQAELTHLQQQSSSADAQTSGWQEQLERIQKQLANVRAERDALINELARRSSGIPVSAEAELSHLRQQIQAAESLQARWQQIQSSLEAELHQLRQRPSAEVLAQRDQTIAELAERLQQFEQLDQQRLQVTAQLQQAEATIQQLTQTLQANSTESAHFFEPLQAQIQTLQTDLSTSQSAQQQIHADLIQTRDQLSHWQQQAQQHLEHGERLQQQYSLVKGELDSLKAELKAERQQAEASQAEMREAMQSRIAALEQQRENLARQLHQTQVEQWDPSVMAELQDQLAHLQVENTQLMEDLEQRPSPVQWQEVNRRLELAEAHYLVSQKQLDKLQAQLEMLKTECVQAHAYAQTQEKEVAILERVRAQLEHQLAHLTGQSAQSSVGINVGINVGTEDPFPAPEQAVQAESPEALPRLAQLPTPLAALTTEDHSPQVDSGDPTLVELFSAEVAPLSEKPTHGIPPLALGEDDADKAARPQKAQAWLRHRPPASMVTRPGRLVELPTFVQRRPG
ncbi:MAG: hypothetical protein HC924_10590 [Synechococcaceae cyanobacterium SM2_3_2]|nr:hypothetical protein [Synechococcaceae cyanobacterium SM2_3_2]